MGSAYFSESMDLSVPQRRNAKEVGDEFVGKYYQTLQNSPEQVRVQFYKDSSKIGRLGKDGVMCSSTLSDLDENLNMLSSGGFDSAEVTSVLSQDSQGEGVLVVVDGYLFTSNERLNKRNFTQTFYLVPHEISHFVINDILMFPGTPEPNEEETKASVPQEETEGTAIFVANLPPNATFTMVRYAFKKFGRIKRYGIHFVRNKNCGFVEFVKANAARMAIEASPIVIGGRIAFVEKKLSEYRKSDYDFWEWQKEMEKESEHYSEFAIAEEYRKFLEEQGVV